MSEEPTSKERIERVIKEHLRNRKPKIVEVGSDDSVIIDKIFGPLVFSNLRITAHAESACWIIERQWIKSGEWLEWVRIPGQFEQEFTEQENANGEKDIK